MYRPVGAVDASGKATYEIQTGLPKIGWPLNLDLRYLRPVIPLREIKHDVLLETLPDINQFVDEKVNELVPILEFEAESILDRQVMPRAQELKAEAMQEAAMIANRVLLGAALITVGGIGAWWYLRKR